MKFILHTSFFILFIIGLTPIFHSCEKNIVSKGVPTLSTSDVADITGTTATCGGTITNEGSSSVTARGVCWSTSTEPTVADSKTVDGAGAGGFSSYMTGLVGATTYYVRAYATNASGTGYGMAMSFITLPTTMTDIDGNVYSLVLIGSQLWFGENLKVTKYNDGSSIANIKPNGEFCNTTVGAYNWAGNATEFRDLYGGLYNWHAVSTGRLCPTGSHVPSNEEWITLAIYLVTDWGIKMKATSGWYDNGNGTNSSGFSGLPGGHRSQTDGGYYGVGTIGYWWTSTGNPNNSSLAYDRALSGLGNSIYKEYFDKHAGMSVRCLRD